MSDPFGSPLFAQQAAGGGMGGPQLPQFGPNDAIFLGLPAPAAAGSRNGRPVIAFDDATDQTVTFGLVMSAGYLAGNLIVDLHWVAATAVIGDVKWDVAFEATAGLNVDTDGFAAIQTVTTTTNGNIEAITSITFTQAQADALGASGAFRLRVTRDTAVAGNMVGDAQFLEGSIRQ